MLSALDGPEAEPRHHPALGGPQGGTTRKEEEERMNGMKEERRMV